jgi:RNA polymerase sigma-70 factor (ECF subfamily)
MGSAGDQVDERPVEQVVEVGESLSMAFLVLLERLSPVERAVFVLREVFGYGYDEIGDIVGKTEANCRQIFVRARQHIDADRPRFAVSREEQEQLVQGFLAACDRGDVDGLVKLLADDVAFHADGGGKAAAAPRPVCGRDRVGRLLGRLLTIIKDLRLRLRPAIVNGQPGALVLDPDGRVVNVVAFDASDEAITGIWSVANPDKLEHVQA